MPPKPPSVPAANVAKAPAAPLSKTPTIVKPSFRYGLALGLPAIHSTTAISPVPSKVLLLAQTGDEPNRPRLTLAGATAIAVGWHEPPKPCLFAFSKGDQTEPPDGEPLSVWLTYPEPPTDLTNPTPYRIFVQVTDPNKQVIRTVHVDTTQPEKIVAEWSEQGM